MNKPLDLNDLKIDTFNSNEAQDSLNDFAEGHGLTEIGASSQTGPNTCGQGSCKTQLEMD